MLRTSEVFQLSASGLRSLQRLLSRCQQERHSHLKAWGSTSAMWHSSLPKWWQMLAGWQHELLTTGIFPYIRFNILITEQLASPRGSGPWNKAGVWMASVTLSWKFMFHHFWDSVNHTGPCSQDSLFGLGSDSSRRWHEERPSKGYFEGKTSKMV